MLTEKSYLNRLRALFPVKIESFLTSIIRYTLKRYKREPAGINLLFEFLDDYEKFIFITKGVVYACGARGQIYGILDAAYPIDGLGKQCGNKCCIMGDMSITDTKLLAKIMLETDERDYFNIAEDHYDFFSSLDEKEDWFYETKRSPVLVKNRVLREASRQYSPGSKY